MTIVGSSAWSTALRRSTPGLLQSWQRVVRDEVERLVDRREVVMLGAIRQQVLSGMRDGRFTALRELLRDFRDEPCLTVDYEEAAALVAACARRGVRASRTDFLICAVSTRLQAEILTADLDFQRIRTVLPVRLHPLSRTDQ